MGTQNLLPALLSVLLVFSGSCPCTGVADEGDGGSHAHHQQSAEAMPGADCPHADCQGCKTATSLSPSKDAAQPTASKYALDDLDWSVIDLAPTVLHRTAGTTGPPLVPVSRAAATPVHRFDLQLE